MQRTRAVPLVMLILAAAGLAWYFTRPATDTGLIGEVEAVRVVFNGEPTDAAYIVVPFTRADDTYAIANVGIDLNRNGVIMAYEIADGSTQEEWVVRNSRAKVVGGGNTFAFTLIDRSVDTGVDFPVSTALTATDIETFDVTNRDAAVAKHVIPSFRVDDFGERYVPGTDPEADGASAVAAGSPAGSDPAGPTPGPMASTDTGFPDGERWLRDTTTDGAGEMDGAPAIGATPAADALPPAGVDFEVFQTDVADSVQGTNECVPTSTSNSLHWLAKRFGFEDRMPETQGETIKELKDDMDWGLEKGGVATRTDFIPGKVAFTRRHDLPIYTHQIGGELDNDIMRKIATELAKGQAVEIVIGYYTQDAETGEWTRNGGHMMTTVGAWSSNGRTYLGFHDPLSPEAGRLDMYQVDGKRMFNYRYRGDSQVYIDRAFAESVTEEWISTHPPKTAIQTNGGIVEAGNLQDTWFIEMLQIGDSWFPIRQFHKFTGAECDRAEHWHANTGNAWGLDMTGHSYFDTNPQRVRARNAPLVQWNDTVDCGAGKTAQVRIANVMISRQEAMNLLANIITP